MQDLEKNPKMVLEYERQPVPEDETKPLKTFLGIFSSEHVAAAELLIGSLFLASGVSASDLLKVSKNENKYDHYIHIINCSFGCPYPVVLFRTDRIIYK